MATKKKAAGRDAEAASVQGYAGHENVDTQHAYQVQQQIMQQMMRQKEERSDEQIVGEAVGKVAIVLNESLAALGDVGAERMLRMIVALCQSELRSGFHG